MYIANAMDDCDSITSTNCTDNYYNIDKIIPTLLFKIPCGISFLCLMSSMIYISIRPVITNKR